LESSVPWQRQYTRIFTLWKLPIDMFNAQVTGEWTKASLSVKHLKCNPQAYNYR
jgi:hypothetical protein